MKVMEGTVKSAKETKTAIVTITGKWMHPLYKKYVKKTKNYACHVEGLEVKEGDIVTIQECRPVSKTKKFKVISIVKEKSAILEVGEVDKGKVVKKEPKKKEKK